MINLRKQFILFLAVNSVLLAEPKDYQNIVKIKETIEGEKLFSQGKYDDAIVLFEQAIEKGEVRGEPHFYIGSIYELRRKYSESIPYFEEAVKKELPLEFREATLWKLILLHRKEENYAAVLEYIDMLEEIGVAHRNLVKYREEAEISLSPEKIEARVKLKEGRKIIEDWEKEHPEENFWESESTKELRQTVLSKFETAAGMDDKLSSLFWEVAGRYEQAGDLENTARVYDIIISKNSSDEAFYKNGVIQKKLGNYRRSGEYFRGALEHLQKENLKYYILINLSQVLYAMGEFAAGRGFASEAVQLQNNPGDIFSPGNLMYCLHSARAHHFNGGEKKCDFNATAKELKKKDPRAVSLYYFSAAVNAMTGQMPNDDQKGKISEYMEKSLIPPSLRNISLKGVTLKPDISSYEEVSWSPLPEWALMNFSEMLPVWSNSENSRNLYIAVVLYKKYLLQEAPEKYEQYYIQAILNTGRIGEGIDFYKNLASRNISQEIVLLKMFILQKDYRGFQSEFLEFIKENPEFTEQLKIMVVEENLLSDISYNEQLDDFKALWKGKKNRIDTKSLPDTAPEKGETDPVQPIPVDGEDSSLEREAGEAGEPEKPAESVEPAGSPLE